MARRFLGFSAVRAPRAVLAVCALVMLLVGSVPLTAGAHTQLRFADPTPGARVAHPPTQVQLRFFKPTVPDPRTKVTMVGPDGTDLAEGPASVSGFGVSQRLEVPHQVGVYVVSYTVVSADEHVLRGRYDFLLTVAAPVAASEGSSTALWIWVGAGVVVLAVAGLTLLRLRQRSSPASTR